MYGDGVIEIPFAGAHPQGHGEALHHLVRAIPDYVTTDHLFPATGGDQLHHGRRAVFADCVAHVDESALVDPHILLAVHGAGARLAEADGADGRMAEYHRGDVVEVQFRFGLSAEEAIGETPPSGDGDRSKRGGRGNIADRMDAVHLGVLPFIDQDEMVAIGGETGVFDLDLVHIGSAG